MSICNLIATKYFCKMFKNIFILWICIFVFIISLAACGRRPLNDRGLSKIIPEEILIYSLDYNENKMSVKNVTIERRQTNDKEDIVYAIISMEDDYIHRTAYYILTINYYDVGGWIIDSWEEYQETEAYPLQPPSESLITNHLNERFKNFSFISNDKESVKDRHYSYTYFVNDEEQNFTRYGEITIIFSLYGSDNLFWRPVINTDDLNISWNIIGNWNITYGRDNVGKLNISQVTNTSIHASSRNFGRGFDQNFIYNLSNNDETLTFQWSFVDSTRTTNTLTFSFNANSAYMRFSNYAGSTQSTLRKI